MILGKNRKNGELMLSRLKKIQLNFALIAFLAYIVKILILEASFADAIVAGVLAGLYGYSLYLKRFQPYKLDEEVRKDLTEVKNAMSKINFVKSQQNKRYF